MSTAKKLEAKLKLLNNKVVSLADLSATAWDKGTCLAEHDHLENCKHYWFKDKIKGFESKAEADIKICIVGFPEGEEFCIPDKQFRNKLLSASGHSCTLSIHLPCAELHECTAALVGFLHIPPAVEIWESGRRVYSLPLYEKAECNYNTLL